jgi:hypothetical protein
VRNTKLPVTALMIPLSFVQKVCARAFSQALSLKLLFFVFVVHVYSLRAQENTIGVEAGRNFYHFSMNDTGNYVSNVSQYSGRTSFGLSFQHRFPSGIQVESGLFYNRYVQQYKSVKYSIIHEEVYNAWVVPIKLAYAFDMFKTKLAVSPFVGYGQGIKTARYVNYYNSVVLNLDQGGIYDSTTRGTFFNDANIFFPLLNVGGRVMYSFSPRIRVSGVFDYFHGLNDIVDASFLYNKGSGKNDHYAEQTGKGSYSSLRLGVHYAFGSNIQKGLQNQRKTFKHRQDKELEGAAERSEPITKKSEYPKWYIGVGIGQTVSFFNFYEFSTIPSGGKTGKLHSLHIDFLYSINKRWMFESGVAQKAIVPPGYISSIGGKPEAGMTIVPIRMNYVINLSPTEVDLMVFAGYSQGIKSDQFSFGFLSPDIDAVGDYYGSVLFPLVDLGTRIKFTLGRIHLGVFASYSQGFKEIYRIQVVDMANVASGFPKLVTSKGSHLNFGLSAYYAVFGRKNK